MCGIAGRFHPTLLPPDPRWRIEADRLLAHRGPDGSGYYASEHCELVHRRLALIDLSPTGAQPMPNEDGSVQVIFNGEVYNHPELRESLQQQGHIFRGTSDTEVLAHLYEEKGAEMVGLLRGMFAFAIYDHRRKTILLARDRFGIKPLYYTFVGEQLVFASELKAILALSGFTPAIDRQACYDFLGLGYVPEPATGFEDIWALPKGSMLTYGPNSQRESRIASYATLRARPQSGYSLEEVTEIAEERLTQAVASQSLADVPVGALLSGGIDSSLVVAAYSRTAGEPPITFNVRFPDAAFDETPVALAVAQRYRTKHHTIDLDEEAITPDAVLVLLRHFDQPFADSSLIPMYYVSRAIRERGIICAMSGDGGDEAFGGYAPFWRIEKVARLMKAPGWARYLGGHAGDLLALATSDIGRQVAKTARLASAGQDDSAYIVDGLSNYLTEVDKRQLVLAEARSALLPIHRHYNHHTPQGVCGLEELSRRLTESFFEVSLPGDMLRKVDMMSMKASIEVRVPMLDEEFVSLGLALTHRLKTDGKTGKVALRSLAARWLPEKVKSHPKHGFSIPLDRMATPAFYRMLDDMLLAPDARTRAFLDHGIVEGWLGLFRQAQAGKHGGAISRSNLYQRVFILLALELWLREHNLTW